MAFYLLSIPYLVTLAHTLFIFTKLSFKSFRGFDVKLPFSLTSVLGTLQNFFPIKCTNYPKFLCLTCLSGAYLPLQKNLKHKSCRKRNNYLVIFKELCFLFLVVARLFGVASLAKFFAPYFLVPLDPKTSLSPVKLDFFP